MFLNVNLLHLVRHFTISAAATIQSTILLPLCTFTIYLVPADPIYQITYRTNGADDMLIYLLLIIQCFVVFFMAILKVSTELMNLDPFIIAAVQCPV